MFEYVRIGADAPTPTASVPAFALHMVGVVDSICAWCDMAGP